MAGIGSSQRPPSGVGANCDSILPMWRTPALPKHQQGQDCSEPNGEKRTSSWVLSLLFTAACSSPLTQYTSTLSATAFIVLHEPITIWRSHMIYSWTKTNKNKIKHKAKQLSMHPREFLDTSLPLYCSQLPLYCRRVGCAKKNTDNSLTIQVFKQHRP